MPEVAVRYFALAVLAAHALGLGPLRDRLWGAHAWAFLPLPWFLAAAALLIVAVLRPPRRARNPEVPSPGRTTGAGGWGIAALAGLGSSVVFELARVRHLLLGDGLPLTASAGSGQAFHPLEPLSMWLNVTAASWLEPFVSGSHPPGYEASWRALAIVSVVAGGLFAATARRLVDETRPTDAGAGGTDWLAWLLVLSQGYVLVFFGYVENYALTVLGFAVYLWLALRCLRRGTGLLAPGLALLLAVGLHFSAIALLPSFAVLALQGWSEPGRRTATVRDLACLVAAATAGVFALRAGAYDPLATTWNLVQGLASGVHEGPRIAGTLNNWLLVGPWGAVAVIAVPIAASRPGGFMAGPERRFLVALCATVVLVTLAAGDSNLGQGRNWDLLAPWGFVGVSAGVAALRAAVEPSRLRGLLVVAVAASLFHTVPWVAINASEERASSRFETLPLGGGRTESTLGYWHALRGRAAEAEAWLRRAVAVAPDNVRAWLFLGQLMREQGRLEESAEAFDRARALRPDLAPPAPGAPSESPR